MDRTYRLTDEPEPSALSRWAVRPLHPMLGLMLGGGWIAWPWFVLNAYALGSPTRRREAAIAAGAALVSVGYALTVMLLVESELLPVRVARYLVIGLVALKLGAGYWIHVLQQRTFGIFEHFGGRVRDPRILIGIALMVRLFVLSELTDFWQLVLG